MKYAHNLITLAKSNRKTSTPAERKLWSLIRGNKLGVSFRRQQQIGQYIVDFVCFEKHLIIECDGGQHNDKIKEEDKIRTAFLEQEGYRVIRFWNNEILYHTDGVYIAIQRALENKE